MIVTKELDPIESEMGKPVTEMSGGELALYIRTYLKAMGVDLPLEGVVERKTMEAFKKRYPGDRAGRIVQHAMLVHRGRKDGRWITTATFSKAMKWWTDNLYLEVQDHEDAEAQWGSRREEVESGWASPKDM